jgi:pimeloyl-ACP methyl ester carboxylesterase
LLRLIDVAFPLIYSCGKSVARPVTVPTLLLHGAIDACNDPMTSADKEKFFTNRYARKLLPNVGHFPQREDPETVAGEIIAWLRE